MEEQTKSGHGWSDRKRYQCLRCYHVNGEEKVGPRYRILDHFLRQHLSLDQAPFHCKLCLFRCFQFRDLQRHVKNFPRHRMLLQEKGVEDSESYLVRNPNPYTVGPRDVAPVAEDTLSQAVDMAFPDGLDFLDNVMEAPQYVPRPYTPDMSAARLDTPRPKEHTPSRVNNAATSPAIMDSLPTIEECRQLKGNQSVSSSSSSSSSSSGKTSCEGCRGVLKELEGIKGMLRGIKSQLEMQGNTNQQLTMTMVNLAGAISSLRAQPVQMPPAVPMTQPTTLTEAPHRRVEEGIRERGRHQDHKENRRPQWHKENSNHYHRRDRSPLHKK
ncbi:hypothetical protein DPMN_119763 [Dreissena polymorpha]|uniref:Uncharacterized protein n=1 Tax=Dreissena polymorpha TaxID=45954 RepID=A0A9D4JS78_DREPO|nr:hypothetical protein DPMN_119763 [Dreissena polymorpha]